MSNATYLLDEVTDSELDQILGAEGVVSTVSHECAMNSFQKLFGCCGD